jgi:endoglucanase
LKEGNRIIDKQVLRAERIQPWKEIQRQGVGVHVGEWGVFNRTPHAVALAFMRDYLDLWREAGWGWALWNLRGSFGVLDSQREDVNYEDFRGHKLDRRMLEVLRG